MFKEMFADKPLIKQVKEIKECQMIVAKTVNKYVRFDYTKRANRLIREVREYCNYKDYDFDYLRRIYDF